jgi:hypothetical protein
MKKIISILLLLILIFGCGNKNSELEFEKDVMLEIYPNLMDSIWVHDSSINNLPFVKLDKKGKVIGYEEQNKNEIRKENKRVLEGIKRKNSKIFAVICDTIYPIRTDEITEFTKYYKNIIISKNITNDTLNKEKISKIRNFKIKFVQKFEMSERPWHTNDDYNFNGMIFFSRIQFDITKKYGILTIETMCGGLCGNGYTIFIKNVNNKWMVDKVELTWIS